MFPTNLTVEYKAQDPRYFTFMSTDATGINSFFHVLIFYEEVNEAEIEREDFDLAERVLRKQQDKEAAKRKKAAESRRTSHQKGPNELSSIKEAKNEGGSRGLSQSSSVESKSPGT